MHRLRLDHYLMMLDAIEPPRQPDGLDLARDMEVMERMRAVAAGKVESGPKT
jgi:hypothetical protein